jgi:glycosyltransferase involved in cell wall biosynthesis
MLSRWNQYALELQRLGGPHFISIISLKKIAECSSPFPNLLFLFEDANKILRIGRSAFRIISGKQESILVCGDHSFSVLFALTLRLIAPKRIKIQTQFHGDVYSKIQNKGVKGIIRVFASRFSLKVADSVRIVSEFQKSELADVYPLAMRKFIISPIPIDYQKLSRESEIEDIFDIAVVGRLHQQRGIGDAIVLLKALLLLKPLARIVIVGSGPERRNVLGSLKKEISLGSVVTYNRLTPHELRQIYGGSKVMLSAAPAEGYGLGIREALLSGMFVVARESRGSLELSVEAPDKILTYRTRDEGLKLLESAISWKRNFAGTPKLISDQKLKDRESLSRLIQSWL